MRIEIDRNRRLRDQPDRGHNRWHPDIPPIATVPLREPIVIETLDSFDGQITPDSETADLAGIERRIPHALTGPLHIEGAMPGDLLVVEIEHVETQPFGFTANFGDFGFLRDDMPERFLARWDIADGRATSRDIPGVSIPGAPFMGVLGVAPSRELFEEITRREAELAERGGRVLLPTPEAAVPADEPIAGTGLRTAPPRENGGNVDIRQATAGTRVFIPVFQPGALFSIGDGHFAQGDGEVCGNAIETGATATVRFDLIEGGGTCRNGLTFEVPGGPPAAPRPYHATTGVCVGFDGTNHSESVTLAARNALVNMLDHIQRTYGLTRNQAYLVSSVAVDLRISQVVNLPNVLVSALLPLDIFE